MATAHAVEYSKSSRAKCHGPPPCRGSCIEAGALRYGQTKSSEYGDTVEWRHWGCVTPDILMQLAGFGLERVNGFTSLRREDQNKVRKAIATRRIDPADVPPTAKIVDQTNTTLPGPSQKKRKSESDGTAQSHSSSSSASQTSSQVHQKQPHLTQKYHQKDQSQEDIADELYCSMTSKIVGVQYYKGLVSAGEQVMLVREPSNQYDRNAIQVKNIGQAQVGHIPRDIASKLAPLLDRRMITVEGVMLQGNLAGFSYALSVELKIYGPPDKRSQMEPLLVWATPGKKGFPPRNNNTGYAVSGLQPPGAQFNPYMAAPSFGPGPSGPQPNARGLGMGMTPAQQEMIRKQQEAFRNAAELKQMLNSLEKVDDEGRRSSLLDTLCSKEDILNLPLHPNPPGIKNGDLVVDLLKHQIQALQWCIEHEYPKLPKTESDKPVQFWQLRKTDSTTYYYNLATKTPQKDPPILGRGALCADSMGLGKTLTMLALILATISDVPEDYCRSTLIVVPLSVLSNWEKQIQEHCVPEALSYCVYYGATRSMSPADLELHDVVLTTYQTVTGEHGGSEESLRKKKKVERSLSGVHWKRIILDEGHTIRNPKTKMAKAVCALKTQRRWVLSGTPIINSPRDLGSLLTFLQVCRPLDHEDFFKRLLLRPLKDGDPEGTELLRALMAQICIRRTKEMQDSKGNSLIPLPPVEMILVPVTLGAEARALYDAVEDLSKKRILNQMCNGDGNNANVLSMLTRMRQIVLHPGLIPRDYLDQLRKSEDEDGIAPTVQIPTKDKTRLQALLAQAIEDSEECPICFNIITDPRITTCAHSFCLNCITEAITRDSKCPMDRRKICPTDLIEPLPPTELTQIPINRRNSSEARETRADKSAKIEQLVHLLKLTPPLEKSLVFSQFTSFLDKIAEALDEEGISYLRFDGTMSAKRRQETIERFSVSLCDKQNDTTSINDRTSRQSSDSLGDTTDEDDTNSQPDDTDYVDMEDSISDCESVFPIKNLNRKGKSRYKKNTRKTNNSYLNELMCRDNPKVLLLSLKAGALGLNLTVANNVYLMDPWWQEGIESQAIDRCNRLGQKKPVHVYQLIAENTVESKVMEIQERKKLLIQQAFSGIKRTETQRERREARMQDLVELFGIRRQASQWS